MKKLLTTASLVLALSPLMQIQTAFAQSLPEVETTNIHETEIATAPSFEDVPENSKYFESVKNVAMKGLMSGTLTNSFRVNSFVTRAEVISAIAKAAELKAKDTTTRLFRDIRKNNPLYAEITAAQEEGLLEVFPTKRKMFTPKAKVTGVQALNALYKAFDEEEFSGEVTLRYEIDYDFPQDWAFTNDIRRAVKDGALLQKTDGSLFLEPTQNLTRGDFASLLYRFTESRKEGTAFGLASWYGDGLSKRKINGARANELAANFLTAANRDLPMGTIIKVTNQDNGKSVEVVVNDSGPYVAGRIIDLSRSAFAAIANVGAGTAVVKIEVIQNAE